MDEEKIILDNLPLIQYCIKTMGLYWKTEDEYQTFYDDGLEGLIKGVKNYNPNKDIKISSFLYPCIKNAIVKGIYLRSCEKRKSNFNTISLNEKVFEDSETELIDFIPDKKKFEEELENKIKIDTIIKILEKETNKENAMIFKMYYGLDGYKPSSYEEIGKLFNITGESVRMRIYRMTNRIKYLFEVYERKIMVDNKKKIKDYDITYYFNLYDEGEEDER